MSSVHVVLQIYKMFLRCICHDVINSELPGTLTTCMKNVQLLSRYTCFVGEARGKLKWADGKAVKNEVDMQVNISNYS